MGWEISTIKLHIICKGRFGSFSFTQKEKMSHCSRSCGKKTEILRHKLEHVTWPCAIHIGFLGHSISSYSPKFFHTVLLCRCCRTNHSMEFSHSYDGLENCTSSGCRFKPPPHQILKTCFKTSHKIFSHEEIPTIEKLFQAVTSNHMLILNHPFLISKFPHILYLKSFCA